jgi:L,D-peptidoglycan transpeptidase YkuD (ErfK/YbiS/YcfS/YnhG family)
MDLIVDPSGYLQLGGARYRCALGRGGVRRDKREGDGATPIGSFALRRLFYRADRIARPRSALATAAIRPNDGWCDDPARPEYNTFVTLPFDGRHENLWRNDALYDIVGVIGYNDAPVMNGLGSAIFLHVASIDYAPTEGCVALALDDLLTVLAACDADSRIEIRDRL